MVPRARIELARCYHRGILSPLRLPISPPRLWCYLWKKRDYSLSTGLISSPYLLLNTLSPRKTDFTDFITKKIYPKTRTQLSEIFYWQSLNFNRLKPLV